MKNIDLMERVIGRIEAEPDNWNQQVWHCGTAMCFAGHTAMLAGATWESDWSIEYTVRYNGESHHVAYFAGKVLGLTPEEADLLFGSSNSLDDIKTIVKDFANA